MRTDASGAAGTAGATSTPETGQQPQSRFEQLMARELSRTSSGRTLPESSIRTTMTATSGKSTPGAERVGVDFKAAQPGKILKGVQESLSQILTKGTAATSKGSKIAFAKLDGALAGGRLKTALGDLKATAGSMLSKGAALATDGAKAALAKLDGAFGTGPGKGDGVTGQSAQGQGGPAQTAGTTTPTAPSTAGTSTQSAPPVALTQTTTPNALATPVRAEGAGAMTTLDPGAAPPAVASGATADASGIQEGRVALAPPETNTAVEAFLLQAPGLLAVSRRAKGAGTGLKTVYMLGPNAEGAEFVSLTKDDKGFITGPDIDIALSDGGIDASGYWSAGAGEGTVNGAKIVLVQSEDGCAFALDGEDGVPQRVTAWMPDGTTLEAEITATREMD